MLRLSAKQIWTQLFVLAGSSLYLYIQLFAYPRIPALLQGDQTYFWVYALRMLRGERIYRDFFQFTPPGTDLYFATLFKLFGSRILVMNLAVLILGAALCWLCFQNCTAAYGPELGPPVYSVDSRFPLRRPAGCNPSLV